MNKITLRWKMTIASVIIFSLMCLVLTVTTLRSSDVFTEAMSTQPAADINQNETVLPAPAAPSIDTPLDEPAALTEAQSQFRTSTWVWMLLIIVVGAGLVYFFTGKVMKPLEKLTKSVEQTDALNLSAPIDVIPAKDEIGRLSVAFNHMLRRLDEAYTVQKQFSANAAHELRTPLAVIQTQIDVFHMKSGRHLDEYESLLLTVDDNTRRLSDIVSGLLKFTNDREVAMKDNVSLLGLLEEVIFELEDFTRQKNILLQLQGDDILVQGNDLLLQCALYNLISNSIKYNTENGTVSIRLDREDNVPRLIIEDTGIGIDDDQKHRIFDPFYRVDQSRSREIGGSGLGLAIVKKVLDKHNAVITVADNTPHGTQFTIDFHDHVPS